MTNIVDDIVDACNAHSNYVLNAYTTDSGSFAVVNPSGRKIIFHVKLLDEENVKLCMSYRHLWYGLKQEYTNVHITHIKHIEKHRMMVYRFVMACFAIVQQSYMILEIF